MCQPGSQAWPAGKVAAMMPQQQHQMQDSSTCSANKPGWYHEDQAALQAQKALGNSLPGPMQGRKLLCTIYPNIKQKPTCMTFTRLTAPAISRST